MITPARQRFLILVLFGLIFGFGVARAEDGAAALPPKPATIPLPPTHAPSTVDDGDDLLLLRLLLIVSDFVFLMHSICRC